MRLSMRQKEYQLLLTACQKTAQSYPQLQSIQHESAEQSATSIKGESETFLAAIFQDRDQTYKAALHELQPMLSIFDLALLQICDLSHLAWDNVDSRARLIWRQEMLPSRPHPNRVFYLLTSNLAQSLQAVRILILHGF